MRIQRIFVILFVFFSWITHAFAEPGANPILSRLTLSDLFGALALAFGVRTFFSSFAEVGSFTRIYRSGLVMILCFFLPIWFSLNLEATLVECLILLFLLLISVQLFWTFKDNLLELFFPLIMWTSIVASLVGMYDYGATILGLPRIFPMRAAGEVLSGFRNAGQAGAYFLVIFSILYALRFSKLFGQMNLRYKSVLNIALILCLIFIALTGKIAAYIGLIVGVFGFAIYKRNIRAMLALGLGGVLLVIVFLNLETVAPTIYERIYYKYDTRITQRLDGNVDAEGDFITNNLGAAIQAFKDRPMTGTGMGGFSGTYSRHEVHSTYFKMIGETGVIGILGYLLFMTAFMGLFTRRKWKSQNPYADFLGAMYPLIIGCLVSWGYTYHLRKREFWILTVVLIIVNYQAIQWQNENIKLNEREGL